MNRRHRQTDWPCKTLAVITGLSALLILEYPLLLFYRGLSNDPFWWLLYLYPWVAPVALAGFWTAFRENWPGTTQSVPDLIRLLLFCVSLVIFIPTSIIVVSGFFIGIYGLWNAPLGLVFAGIVGITLWAAVGENWPSTGRRLPLVIRCSLQMGVALITLAWGALIVIIEYFTPTEVMRLMIGDILTLPEVLTAKTVWSVGLAVASVRLWRTGKDS